MWPNQLEVGDYYFYVFLQSFNKYLYIMHIHTMRLYILFFLKQCFINISQW